MNNKWKWAMGVGAVLLTVTLVAFPLIQMGAFATGGYRMMGHYGYGWHMPFMSGGFGMMGFGITLFWLIGIGLLILIGLAIAWFLRELTGQKS